MMNKLIQRIIKKTVAPMLMEEFNRLTQEDFHNFLTKKENGALLNHLQENQADALKLKYFLMLVPYSYKEKAKETILSRKWMQYFIDNEIKHKRPDLYIEITFSEGAVDYLQNEISMVIEELL